MMDVIREPGVEEVWIVSGTQVGKSTIQENLLGYWVDNDPGPCLIVKPTENAVEESIRERWRPLLETSPSLSQHLSANREDNTLGWIRLDTMPIYFGWAGSPQSLASRPCRYVLLDECDKFPPFAGREADPISLAKERTATYGHRKRVVAVSTPTTREGPIWRGWESCGDQRHYFVPCPHCHAYQRLVWSQVKWPKLAETDKVKRADEIERCRLAWYECEHCKGRIEDSHKPRMLEHGRWLSQGQSVAMDGTVTGDRPASKRVGFHLNSLYSPWRTFAEMAAEFIRAEGDIALTMNFRNSRLAEPFEVQIGGTDADAIRDKIRHGNPTGTIPAFTQHVFATADVQQDRIYYVIRAWGYGFRSAGIRHGMVLSFEELWHAVFETPLVYTPTGAHLVPELLGIDDQYRRNEVIEFQKRDPRRILRTHGLSTYDHPIALYRVEQGGLPVLNINTLLSKDRLDQVIKDGDPTRWTPHAGVDDDYCSQMASEHKVWDQQRKRELWKQKTGGRANHYWDCEANQCAVATHRHMDVPPPPEPVSQPPTKPKENAWLRDRPESWI